MKFAARFFSKRTLLADRFLYASPGCLGLEARDVEFESKGVRLRGWFLRGERAGTVVFCSGNSANVSCHLEYVRMIRDTGYSVLCFDYRGFGRSEGVPDLRGIVDDVSAACLKAREIIGEEEPLGLFGISLGANAAMAAAARASGSARPRALIVEGLSDLQEMLTGLFSRNSFGPLRIREIVGPDGATLARERLEFGRWRVPRPLAKILAWFAVRTYPFEGRTPRRFAREIRETPTFVVHGVDDELLPFEAAIDAYNDLEGASSLWLIPGAGHAQEPVLSHRLEYVAQVSSFLTAAFDGAAQVNTPQDDTVQDDTVQDDTVQDDTVQDDTVQDDTVQDDTAQDDTAQDNTGPRLRCEETSSAGSTLYVEPAREQGRSLVTVVGRSTLWQRVVDGAGELRIDVPGPCRVVSVLPLTTLGADGSPGQDLDPLSRAYREEGYRSVFRRLVRAVNAMDPEALDAALADYLLLERRFPFDFFAAVYCLRLALVARNGQPGWPAVSRPVGTRSLERFLALWQAHPFLPDESVLASPAAWARRALDG